MYLSPFLSFLRSLSSSSSSSSFSSSSLSRPFIAPWRWRGRLSRWFFTSPFSTPSSTTPLFQGGRGWAGSRLFPTWMSSRLSSASLLPTSSISSPWSTQPSTTGWAYLRTSMLAKYSLLHRHGTPFPPSPFSMSLTRTSPLCVSSSPTTPTDQEGGWWWQDWTVSSSFMMYSNALTTLFHGWTRWVTLFYGLLMIQLYFPFTSTSTSNCTSCCTSPFLDSIHVHPTLKNEPSVNVWSLWVQIFMMMYFGYTCFQSVHWVMLQVLQSLALCP
ncbi:hypothetical protein HMI54_010697 [Coelomomyces lativittatus]|nr:hypothetical protein HMI54_010697 [Coelomomyces lativittatus]